MDDMSVESAVAAAIAAQTKRIQDLVREDNQFRMELLGIAAQAWADSMGNIRAGREQERRMRTAYHAATGRIEKRLAAFCKEHPGKSRVQHVQSHLAELEEQRLRNIARNKAILNQLGLGP